MAEDHPRGVQVKEDEGTVAFRRLSPKAVNESLKQVAKGRDPKTIPFSEALEEMNKAQRSGK